MTPPSCPPTVKQPDCRGRMAHGMRLGKRPCVGHTRQAIVCVLRVGEVSVTVCVSVTRLQVLVQRGQVRRLSARRVFQVLVRRVKVTRLLVLVQLRRRHIRYSQIALWQYCAQVLQYSTCLLVELIQLRTRTSIVTMTFTTSIGCSMHVVMSKHACWQTQHACCNTQQHVCNNMLVRRCNMHAAILNSMFATCTLQYSIAC